MRVFASGIALPAGVECKDDALLKLIVPSAEEPGDYLYFATVAATGAGDNALI